ncbi:MAG: HD domain-containing protein [Anaerolineales bacterium]|nr:HD domain-containing protein [Anaerolineales bacterium]
MQTKAPNPISLLDKADTLPIIAAYFEISHLKQLYRQGWLRRGIPTERCESVAEHSFGVAVLAFLLAETYFPDLDHLKVLRMALIHDFGEIYAGDFTPGDNIPPEEKNQLERESAQHVFGKLPQGAQYIQLWEEFESGKSPEAQFIQQVDKLEMVLQASVYEHQGWGGLDEFFCAKEKISLPELQHLLESLVRQ